MGTDEIVTIDYADEVLDPFAERVQSILLSIATLAPLEEVAMRLAESARELTGADYAAIGVYDALGRLDHFVTVGMSPDERALMPHPPVGRGLLGEFARVRRTIRVSETKAHGSSTGYPAHHPPMGPFLGVPVVAGDQPIGAFYVTRKPGTAPFTAEDAGHLENLAPYAAIAMSNAIVHESEQRRADVAAELTAFAAALHSAASAEEVAAVVARTLGRVFPGGEFGVLLSADSDGATDEAYAGAASLHEVLSGLRDDGLAAGEHRLPYLLEEGALVVNVAGDDPAVLVALARRPGASMSAVDRDALRQVTETASIGLAAHRRREAEAILERYALRDEIARDLHDDLIQSIYAIGLGMRSQSDDPEALRRLLDNATKELNEVIRDLRAYIEQLSMGTEGLTSTGLLATRIQALVRGQSAPRWELEVDPGAEALGARLERQLYLIVREAVSNVFRHAQASHASLSLVRVGNVMHLDVRDNGIGFDRSVVPAGAVGLRSLEERVADVGGSIQVTSSAGGGTHIEATFPLQEGQS